MEATCTEANGCGISGKISGGFGGLGSNFFKDIGSIAQSPLVSRLLMNSSGVPDARSVSIEVGGGIYYPQSSQISMNLYDSQARSVQAIEVFSWVRDGSTIRLADPDAVNDWALTRGGTADTLGYDLVPWTPSAPPGPADMFVQSSYGNVPTSFAYADVCFDMHGEIMEVEAYICH